MKVTKQNLISMNEAPLNLGQINYPTTKQIVAIQRKLRADAPEILKQYRELLRRLQLSKVSGKEIVYIRDEPDANYRERTGLGDSHSIEIRDKTNSPLGKEVVAHKNSGETSYETILAIKEESKQVTTNDEGVARIAGQVVRGIQTKGDPAQIAYGGEVADIIARKAGLGARRLGKKVSRKLRRAGYENKEGDEIINEATDVGKGKVPVYAEIKGKRGYHKVIGHVSKRASSIGAAKVGKNHGAVAAQRATGLVSDKLPEGPGWVILAQSGPGAKPVAINEAVMVNFDAGDHHSQRWGKIHARDLIKKLKKANVKHKTDNAYYVSFDITSYNSSSLAKEMPVSDLLADIKKNNGRVDFSERDAMGRKKRFEEFVNEGGMGNEKEKARLAHMRLRGIPSNDEIKAFYEKQKGSHSQRIAATKKHFNLQKMTVSAKGNVSAKGIREGGLDSGAHKMAKGRIGVSPSHAKKYRGDHRGSKFEPSKDRDARGGRWDGDDYTMSKKDYARLHKDFKSKIKGKPYATAMDPKTGATILTPVIITEKRGAEDPYTVKYWYDKQGRKMWATLSGEADAKKFLKNVKGLGMGGVIIKGDVREETIAVTERTKQAKFAVGNRPGQASDPYTVKYSYTKKGRIMVATLASKKDAETFLKNVKGLGMRGIIVKGAAVKEEYIPEAIYKKKIGVQGVRDIKKGTPPYTVVALKGKKVVAQSKPAMVSTQVPAIIYDFLEKHGKNDSLTIGVEDKSGQLVYTYYKPLGFKEEVEIDEMEFNRAYKGKPRGGDGDDPAVMADLQRRLLRMGKRRSEEDSQKRAAAAKKKKKVKEEILPPLEERTDYKKLGATIAMLIKGGMKFKDALCKIDTTGVVKGGEIDQRALKRAVVKYAAKEGRKALAAQIAQESELKEGTWSIPNKPATIKKLRKLLKKPFPVGVSNYNDPESSKEGAEAKLKGILGDDELFSKFDALRKRKGPKADVGPLIRKWLKKNDNFERGGVPKDVAKIWTELGEGVELESINEAVRLPKNIEDVRMATLYVMLQSAVVKKEKTLPIGSPIAVQVMEALNDIVKTLKKGNRMRLTGKAAVVAFLDAAQEHFMLPVSPIGTLARKYNLPVDNYSSTVDTSKINVNEEVENIDELRAGAKRHGGVLMVRTMKQEDGSYKWILQRVEHEGGKGKQTVVDTGTEDSRSKADRAGQKAKKKHKVSEEYIVNLKEAVDQNTVRELVLYITNDGQLYRQRTTSIIKNLSKKVGDATYDGLKAIKAFMYLVKDGIKKYEKEHASPGWARQINKETKQAIAEELLDYYTEEIGE